MLLSSLPTWTYPLIACAALGGIALSVASNLRKQKPKASIAFSLIFIALFSFVAYGIHTRPKPYDIEIRPVSFDAIFSGAKGKSLVITNHDTRTVTIKSVTLNEEFSVTKLFDSTPRGESAEFSIKPQAMIVPPKVETLRTQKRLSCTKSKRIWVRRSSHREK